MDNRFDKALRAGWEDMRALGSDVDFEAFKDAVCLVLGELAAPTDDKGVRQMLTVSDVIEMRRLKRLARG